MKKRIKLPGPRASYAELNRFFDRHDGTDLLAQGIRETQPKTRQLKIRIPAAAKRIIERLARRKTV